MAFMPIKGETDAERLESFYKKQVDAYDQFREKLLTGRDQLMTSIPLKEGDALVDVGCGTGYNLTFLPEGVLSKLGKVTLLDLTESMLKTAQERAQKNHWDNVEVLRADATEWRPEKDSIDAATLSYSLTMIPDWFAAIDRVYDALKPGGYVGVVDFYIARKYPSKERMKQNFTTRWLWPIWFSFDNLFLSSDMLPYLSRKFEEVILIERADRMPYCPFFWKKTPRFVFIGRKPLN